MIQRILLFILAFSGWLATVQAQEKPVAPPADSAAQQAAAETPAPVLPDSIYWVPGGLRLGVDISRIVVKVFQPYRTDVSFAADYRYRENLYIAAEAGWQGVSHSDSNYTYKSSGVFVTAGVDYNFLKKQETRERYMFYGGIRYGFAQMSYEAPSYTIYDSYWGDKLPGSFPKTNASAHWVELILGIKAEVLKNFFVGWSIREKIKISGPKSDVFPPIVIPGFGSGTKGSQFDFQYTISYSIPLGDVKVRVKREGAGK